MNLFSKACCCLWLVAAAVACSRTDGAESEQPVPAPALVKGADVSWISEQEAAGHRFYDRGGTQRDLFALLHELGLNTIRLRLWVNPDNGWNGKADVLVKAKRAKAAGFRLMLNFHYSDSWADPGKQTKPAAWANLGTDALNNALAAHTTEVLQMLKAEGIEPEWVQVGNETNNGMLWPEGKASENMAAFARMVNSGHNAVKAVFPKAKVVVHLSNGWDRNLYQWLFDGLRQNGARWDVIGLSVYPTPSNWATINAQVLANMQELSLRYGSELMIVEAGMPWDSSTESKAFLTDLLAKTATVKKGLGVLYWEPQTPPGWQGYTLGAFGTDGKPTAAMDAFKD